MASLADIQRILSNVKRTHQNQQFPWQQGPVQAGSTQNLNRGGGGMGNGSAAVSTLAGLPQTPLLKDLVARGVITEGMPAQTALAILSAQSLKAGVPIDIKALMDELRASYESLNGDIMTSGADWMKELYGTNYDPNDPNAALFAQDPLFSTYAGGLAQMDETSDQNLQTDLSWFEKMQAAQMAYYDGLTAAAASGTLLPVEAGGGGGGGGGGRGGRGGGGSGSSSDEEGIWSDPKTQLVQRDKASRDTYENYTWQNPDFVNSMRGLIQIAGGEHAPIFEDMLTLSGNDPQQYSEDLTTERQDLAAQIDEALRGQIGNAAWTAGAPSMGADLSQDWLDSQNLQLGDDPNTPEVEIAYPAEPPLDAEGNPTEPSYDIQQALLENDPAYQRQLQQQEMVFNSVYNPEANPAVGSSGVEFVRGVGEGTRKLALQRLLQGPQSPSSMPTFEPAAPMAAVPQATQPDSADSPYVPVNLYSRPGGPGTPMVQRQTSWNPYSAYGSAEAANTPVQWERQYASGGIDINSYNQPPDDLTNPDFVQSIFGTGDDAMSPQNIMDFLYANNDQIPASVMSQVLANLPPEAQMAMPTQPPTGNPDLQEWESGNPIGEAMQLARNAGTTVGGIGDFYNSTFYNNMDALQKQAVDEYFNAMTSDSLGVNSPGESGATLGDVRGLINNATQGAIPGGGSVPNATGPSVDSSTLNAALAQMISGQQQQQGDSNNGLGGFFDKVSTLMGNPELLNPLTTEDVNTVYGQGGIDLEGNTARQNVMEMLQRVSQLQHNDYNLTQPANPDLYIPPDPGAYYDPSVPTPQQVQDMQEQQDVIPYLLEGTDQFNDLVQMVNSANKVLDRTSAYDQATTTSTSYDPNAAAATTGMGDADQYMSFELDPLYEPPDPQVAEDFFGGPEGASSFNNTSMINKLIELTNRPTPSQIPGVPQTAWQQASPQQRTQVGNIASSVRAMAQQAQEEKLRRARSLLAGVKANFG